MLLPVPLSLESDCTVGKSTKFEDFRKSTVPSSYSNRIAAQGTVVRRLERSIIVNSIVPRKMDDRVSFAVFR